MDLTLAKALFIALSLVDWSQTRWHEARGYQETQPIMASNFHPEGINLYFTGYIAGNLALSHYLPPPWNERLVFTLIGVEGQSVWNNTKFGIQATW